MSLRTRSAQEMASTGGTSGKTLLFDMRVSGESNSPQTKMTVDTPKGKKELVGRYEHVMFLCPLSEAPVIMWHNKYGAKGRVLSGLTFPQLDTCPVKELLDSYPDKDERKEITKLSGAMTSLFLPVLPTRCQKEPVLTKQGGSINPVNWFELGTTSYIPETNDNYQRLKDADDEYPIHKYLYVVFSPKRGEGERQQFYFQVAKDKNGNPIKLTGAVIDKLVTVEHPLIEEWLDEDANFVWDDEYYEMLSALAILKFQRFVDPKTKEAFDYGGLFEQAEGIFNEYKAKFPPPVGQPPDNNSEDISIPF